MAKKDTKLNGTEEERKDLYILQLKIVALNNKLDAMQSRQTALAAESGAISTAIPKIEEERNKLLNEYKPRYTELKSNMEVPEGSELNLETGEVVATTR